MYAYCLLVRDEQAPTGYSKVRPGPDMDIPTMAELQAQVKRDIGFVPDWLVDCPPGEYIGVEDDQEIRGTWFCLEIEGSELHVMPPLAERIAFEQAAKRGDLPTHFPVESPWGEAND